MSLLRVCIGFGLGLIFPSLLLANVQDVPKKKGQDTYQKYETEEVKYYRDAEVYTAPAFPEPEEKLVEAETQGIALEDYFNSTPNVFYVDFESRLQTLVNRHIAINANTKVLDGYKVQVYAGADRQAANRAKSTFLNLFPEYSALLSYVAPNYRVRVGEFILKQQADLFKREIKEYFPGAFVVPDRVPVPKE